MSPHLRRSVIANALVVIIGTAALIAGVIGAAQLDPGPSRQAIVQAFDSGVLTSESTRTFEVVTGFVVRDIDTFSTCTILSLTQAPASEVFGIGPWSSAEYSCGSVYRALTGEPGEQSWYRYWHGAAAVLKVLFSVMSVYSAQILVTLLLFGLLAFLIWSTWRLSPTFALGSLVILGLTSDLLWHGLSIGLGVSTVTGLAGSLAVLWAFRRGWYLRWAIVALAGLSYAVISDMFLPMAFAILSGTLALAPLLRQATALSWKSALVGGVVSAVWVVGYVIGLATRYVWIGLVGPGWDSLISIGDNASYFLSASPQEPVIMLLSQLMGSWLSVGFMQVGLTLAFAIFGWSLAKGGASGALRASTLVALIPFLFGVAWLAIWGGHTMHLFVNVLLSIMLLSLLMASEVARHSARAFGDEPDDQREGQPITGADRPVPEGAEFEPSS